jgi:hypothetical protein
VKDGMTRGEALCNPLNIRISHAPWKGKITPSRDHEFEQFDTPEHGIRAAAKILLNYGLFHDLKTVRAIVTRWAPPSENNTEAYISGVCDDFGADPDETLNLKDPAELESLVKAMLIREAGRCVYTDDQIQEAVEAALA